MEVRAHLDQNATTAALPEVVAAVSRWLAEPAANPSAGHPAGQAAADAVRAARGSVADLVGALHPSEIVFTSGGTESTCAAVRAAVAARPGRRRLVRSAVEHSATKRALEGCGDAYEVAVIPVDSEGRLDRDALFAAIDGDTALVSLMLANNETGVLTDLEGVGAACRAAGALFHIDAVQVPGKHPIDVETLGCDLASLSGHKFHGPRGTGILFVRDGLEFTPSLVGGPQEAGRRAGTENTPGIIGLGVAARIAAERARDPAALSALAAKRDRLEAGLLAALPGTRVNGGGAPRVANTTNLGLDLGPDGPDAAAVLALLFASGIEASSGSACSARKMAPSPVLLAMGQDERPAACALRLSLSHATTDEEIDRAQEAIVAAVEALRAIAG